MVECQKIKLHYGYNHVTMDKAIFKMLTLVSIYGPFVTLMFPQYPENNLLFHRRLLDNKPLFPGILSSI